MQAKLNKILRSFIYCGIFLSQFTLVSALATTSDVSQLTELLMAESTNDRMVACKKLTKLGPLAKDAVPTLIMILLTEKSGSIRNLSINALNAILVENEIEAKNLLLYLFNHVKSKDPLEFVQKAAADAIEKIDPNVPTITDEKINILIKSLQNENDTGERINAATKLKDYGKEGKDAIPALIISLLTDPYAHVRINASKALGEIVQSEIALPSLFYSFTNDNEKYVRIGALKAIANIGVTPLKVVPKLVKALRTSNDLQMSITLIEAIGKFGPSAVVGIDELILQLKNLNKNEIRVAAATAIGKIGPNAQKAVPALLFVIRKNLDNVAFLTASANALSLIGSNAVPGLIITVENSNENEAVQIIAVQILDKIGPNAALALKSLRKINSIVGHRGAFKNALTKAISHISGQP